MTDPKEFESIDDLFKKSFDNLPDTPAASGWDLPSEKVWQHVQTQIKPPRAGWSTQTIVLIAAFAVTLAIGLYFYAWRTDSTQAPPATSPVAVETPETRPSEKIEAVAVETPEVTKPAPEEPSAGKKQPKANKRRPVADKNDLNSEQQAANEQDNVSAYEPDQPAPRKIVSSNTIQRRKAELSRRAEAAWKTPLDPLPMRWPKSAKKDISAE